MAEQKAIFAPEEAMEQLHIRSQRVYLIRVVFDLQRQLGLSNELTLTILACYLSDSLVSMTERLHESIAREQVAPIEYVKDGQKIRAVYLPNAARAMYDALTEVQWCGHEAGYCPQCANGSLEGHKPACILGNAIAAAEGR